MIRRPPRSTPKPSSAASDVYKRQLPEDEEDFQNEELSNIDSNETESESDVESSEIDSNIDTDDTETEESDIDETIEDTVTAKDKIITEEEGTR